MQKLNMGCARAYRAISSGCHTASETFDVGVDLGSPVAPDYDDRAPFRFTGKIEKIYITYTE